MFLDFQYGGEADRPRSLLMGSPAMRKCPLSPLDGRLRPKSTSSQSAAAVLANQRFERQPQALSPQKPMGFPPTVKNASCTQSKCPHSPLKESMALQSAASASPPGGGKMNWRVICSRGLSRLCRPLGEKKVISAEIGATCTSKVADPKAASDRTASCSCSGTVGTARRAGSSTSRGACSDGTGTSRSPAGKAGSTQ